MEKNKKKKILMTLCICIPVLVCSLFLLLARTSETQEIWLQRYDEKIIEVKRGNVDDYRWQSSDDSVVIVENGKLIAQKTSTEPVTVTGKSFLRNVNIVVKRINDTAGKPKIVLEDSRAYVGIDKKLSPKIVYNGTEMDTSTHQLKYTSSIGDTKVALSDGLTVMGLQEGETVVSLQTEYKGLIISGSAKLTVKPATYVEIKEDTIELFKADNNKVNQIVLSSEVCINGKEIEKPQINYRVIEGDESCVSFENNTVIAKKIGQVTVEASLKDHENASDVFVVNVNPPYETETFTIVDTTKGVSYEPYTGQIGGRSEGITRYISGKHSLTPEGWNDIWPHRIVNSKIGSSIIEAYRSGYRYFTYDIYLKDPSRLLVGYTSGGTTYDIPYDTFFYSSWVKILNENGDVVNRVVKDQWLTVVYDIYAFILEYPSATLSYFYTSHNEGKEIFFSNICYRYDDSFMNDDGVSYEKQDGYVQASNSEFHSYASADNSIYQRHGESVDNVKGAYKLTGHSDDYLQNTMVAVSTLGTSRGDSLVRLAERGKYLTFDLYIQDATAIYFSILSKEVEFMATVGVTDFSKCDWISIIANGKRQYTLEKDRWQTICIDYEELALNSNVYSNLPVAFEFGVMNKKDIVYVNNVRYYQNNKFMPKKYEGTAPLGIDVKNKNKATLENVKSGEFAGTALYTNVTGNGEIYFQEVQNGTRAGTFFNMGKRYISFAFYLNSNVASFNIKSSVTRLGYTIYNQSTVKVGKTFTSDGNLCIYDTKGKAVKQVKAGQWYILEYYVEYMDKPESVDVTFRANSVKGKKASVYIRDLVLTKTPSYGKTDVGSAFVPGWINVSGSEASVVRVQGGKFAGTDRYINWTQSDYSGVSFSTIKDGSFYKAGYKYLSFDFYLTEDVSKVTFFSWITNPKEKNTAFSQSIEIGNSFAQDERIYFFDASGKTVNRLQAGQWYTVTYKMNYPSSPDWSFIYIRTSGNNGSVCYLKNFKGSNKLPYKYEKFKPIKAESLGFIAGNGATVTNTTKDGVSAMKAVLQKNGRVLFSDVIDNQSKKGDFFASGYKYVTFDMYIESGEAFLFNTSTHNIWTNGAGYDWSANEAGKFKQGDYLRTYMDGFNKPIDRNMWYTVSMKVEDYSREVSIAAIEASATIYLKNLTFSNDFPIESEKISLEMDSLGFIAGEGTTITKVTKDGQKVVKAELSGSGKQVYFKDVVNEYGGKGKFFASNYQYVTFDMYIESASAFLFNTSTHGIWTNGAGYDWSANAAGNLTQGDYLRAYLDGVRVPITNGKWFTVSMKVENYSTMVSIAANGGPATIYLKNLTYTNAFPQETKYEVDSLGFVAGEGTAVTQVTKNGEKVVKAELSGSGKQIYFKDVITEGKDKGIFFNLGYQYVTFEMYIESASAFLFNTSTHGIWTNGAGYDWSANAAGNLTQGDYLRAYLDGVRVPITNGKWFTVSMKVENYSTMVSIAANGGPATIYLKNLTYTNAFPQETKYEVDSLGFVAGEGTAVTQVTKNGEKVVKAELSGSGKQIYFKDVITEGKDKGIFFNLGYKYVTFDMYIESANAFLFNTSTHGIWTNGAGYDWSNNAAGSGKQGDYLRTYLNGVRTPINKGAWYTVSMKVENYSQAVSIASNGGAATIYLKNLTFANDFPKEVKFMAESLGFVAGDGTTLTKVTKDGEEVVKAELSASGKRVYFQDVITAGGEKGKFFSNAYQYVTFDMYIESVASAFNFNTSTHGIWTNGAGYDWSNNAAGSGKQGDYLRTYLNGVRTPINKGAWYTVSMKVENYSQEVSIAANGGAAIIYLKNLIFANAFPE